MLFTPHGVRSGRKFGEPIPPLSLMVAFMTGSVLGFKTYTFASILDASSSGYQKLEWRAAADQLLISESQKLGQTNHVSHSRSPRWLRCLWAYRLFCCWLTDANMSVLMHRPIRPFLYLRKDQYAC